MPRNKRKIKDSNPPPMNKKKKVKGWAVILNEGKLMDERFFGEISICHSRERAKDICRETWDGKVIPVEITFPAPKKNLEKRNKK